MQPSADRVIDTQNPPRPSRIRGLRPRTSDRLAQNGEEIAHSRADSEKIAATMASGIPICRPMAGRTDSMPVLPSAVAADTPNRMAKARRLTC